jgi:hypothetical protein
LRFTGARAEDDYGRVAACFDLDADCVVRVRQAHGRDVCVVRPDVPVAPAQNADAIVSLDPARVISVRVADCVPVLIADRGSRLVAAVHAGWRGMAAGAIGAALAAIAREGVAPADLVCAIGPAIGPCCFQVDEVVRHRFRDGPPASDAWFADDGPGHWRLDLWRAAAEQLRAAGVPGDAVHAARRCTADDPVAWYSHRRDGGGTGRMVAAIRLTADGPGNAADRRRRPTHP